MAVIWTTFQYDDAEVSYGEDPNKLLYTATHEGVKQWMSGSSARYSHRAMMRNLKPSTNYYYQIGARSFSFNTLPENPQTYKACIFGDLGYFHGNSTASLIKNGLAGKFDFIVHLGDIAYDLHTKNGTTGDNYMNQLEPLFSKVPYMVIAGNHEDDGKNFTDYQERFWMPHNGYGNFKEKHCRSSESSEPFLPLNSRDWIEKFEIRIRTGWLDMPGLESLFLQQGMDVGFWGHEHSYERFYPIADKQFWNDTNAYNNPNAPVYVISGSAVRHGCHTPYTEFSENPWPFSAARVNDYGYSILSIANSTHIHLEQISIEKGDTVVDEVWIVKEKSHQHSQALRKATPGWKFPAMKCHPKNIACRMSLQQLNEEL
ncbi:Ser/Thr phosphatase family protein [Necator americanus]|uniref:Purple acid phosphatase n=1 Tax=Necator americanus TaxID=51031 RepID=W2T0P9_NECAM|nr:Ser/Thr phosphatase family protein [Necator americanus]ETN75473.1 Ser/Thr phosphatase family protein [Necator americanus]